MGFTKIIEEDIKNKGVVGLPDTPNLSTSEMQAKFDELALDVIIPKVNNLIAEIEAVTASASIGIEVDDELSADKKLQSAFNNLYTMVKAIGVTGHSHDNKEVLDRITDTLLTELASIITLLGSIDEVALEINGSATALATCKAVSDYVQELGGGDMTRAVYDTNRSGVVDDSEKLGGKDPAYYQPAEDNTLQTTSKTVTGAINELKSGLDNAEVDTLVTMEEVEAATDETIPVGAGAIKELNESLGGLRFGYDGDSNTYGYYGDDDVLIPFTKYNGEYKYTKVTLTKATTNEYTVSGASKIVGVVVCNDGYADEYVSMYMLGNIMMNKNASACPIINYVKGNVISITTHTTSFNYKCCVFYE